MVATLGTIAALPGLANVDPADLAAFYRMCQRLGVSPDNVGAVIEFETGGTWDPATPNSQGSGAVGLIQFMPSTAAGLLGLNRDLRSDRQKAQTAFAKMSFQQQLKYVEKYLAPYAGRMTTLARTYAAVIAPDCISGADDAPCYSKPSIEYTQNSGLDHGNKGYISKADLAATIQSKLNTAHGQRLAVLDVPPGGGNVALAGLGSASLTVVAAAAGYALAEWYTRKHGLALPPLKEWAAHARAALRRSA